MSKIGELANPRLACKEPETVVLKVQEKNAKGHFLPATDKVIENPKYAPGFWNRVIGIGVPAQTNWRGMNPAKKAGQRNTYIPKQKGSKIRRIFGVGGNLERVRGVFLRRCNQGETGKAVAELRSPTMISDVYTEIIVSKLARQLLEKACETILKDEEL